MTGQPGTYQQVVAIAAAGTTLYCLRDDGAVFVLLRRGDMRSDGSVLRDPIWIPAPAIPGTIAALEQEGRPG